MSMLDEVKGFVLRAAPPVSAIAAELKGMTLDDWIKIAVLLYTVLQIAYLLNKWAREIAERKAG